MDYQKEYVDNFYKTYPEFKDSELEKLDNDKKFAYLFNKFLDKADEQGHQYLINLSREMGFIRSLNQEV